MGRLSERLSEVRARRARRRLRCWLGLPMRAELDPVARDGLTKCLSFVWSESGWVLSPRDLTGGRVSALWVDALRRAGLWRSPWWLVVPVYLQDAVGCWGIGPGLPEDASAEFLSELSEWRSDELHDLSAECLSAGGLSSERRSVVSEVSYLLGRRRR